LDLDSYTDYIAQSIQMDEQNKRRGDSLPKLPDWEGKNPDEKGERLMDITKSFYVKIVEIWKKHIMKELDAEEPEEDYDENEEILYQEAIEHLK